MQRSDFIQRRVNAQLINLFKGDLTMNLRFAPLFVILLITLVGCQGCQRTKNMTTDVMPSGDPMLKMLSEMDIEDLIIEVELPEAMILPGKIVWFINFPEGGKDAYNDWLASVGETLRAQELVRSRIYDNVDPDMRPNQYLELEFESSLDAEAYMNRPEIAALLEDATNHITDQTVYTFTQRSYDSKDAAGDWQVKRVFLIDFPVNDKVYGEWFASISQTFIEHPELKAIASYDNYSGEAPHRLVTLEFANQEDLGYLEEIQAISDEDARRRGVFVRHTFQLLSADVKGE